MSTMKQFNLILKQAEAEFQAKIKKDCPPGMRPVKLRGCELRAVRAGHIPQRYVPITSK
jgi:hypothetical protein